MKRSLKYREIIGDARRVVVKIGSRVLVQKTGRPDVVQMQRLAKQVASIHKSGREVLVVTSGAVGAGMEALGMKTRPSALPDVQMAAAVGQAKLMAKYDHIFSKLDIKVGQILLTHEDFEHKVRLTNAHRTIENLLRNRVIPIVNENDVVADEELRADVVLGDNDYLAALLVNLVRADLLVILSTVDGVRNGEPGKHSRRVRYIESFDSRIFALAKKNTSHLSKGGMASKLRAAQTASKAGCTVVIAKGRQNGVLQDVMKGKDVGTIVLASGI